MAPPRATYRLQLNPAFGFGEAARLVPYLARLGVSHCYFSPYLKTRPGSTHGYDIIDHEELNPELGSAADHEALCTRLREHGMGQIIDVVPNHIGVMGGNGKWWSRVLENGQATRYADFFDIDWLPVTPELRNKVLVPVLGDQYGHVLLAGDLKLVLDEAMGELSVYYFEHRFPLDPSSYPRVIDPGGRVGHAAADRPDFIELESIIRSLQGLPPHTSSGEEAREVRAHEVFTAKRRLAELCARSPAVAGHLRRAVAAFNGMPGERASFEPLHELLEVQPYRLAFWRVAADEINYRRFFDINDLAGLSTQNEEVLEVTHRLVLQWVAEGKVQGFRIDHPDGLYDPLGYLTWLKTRLAALGHDDHYLVVEKILAAHEHLPRSWPVHGTTGYDFAFAVNGLLVYAPAEKELDAVYRDFTGERSTYEALLTRAKREIISFHLSSELTVLANLLNRLAEARLETRDFTLNAARDALLELIVSFPVYRSYVTATHVGVQDRTHIEWAVGHARQSYDGHDEGILELIRSLLLFELPEDTDDTYRREAARFAAKFQQFTAPIMAKAFEDTLFYRYLRLLSLNEVGSDPRRFGVTPAAFHRLAELRLQYWPHSMLGTSTHDSKRSEDVRARLDVLSEISAVWRTRLWKWRRYNRAKRRRVGAASVPSRHEEYLLYQTLVGSWPAADRAAGMPAYRERIEAYMVKALREAKVSTSWARPRTDYEEQVLGFIRDVLADAPRNHFVEDLDELAHDVARPGFLNGLTQTLLKLTSPGVPDVYQGNELWDFSLVDPDNRRPVDYALRRELLDGLDERAADEARLPALVRELLEHLDDGRLKLYLISRVLRCRAELPELFALGAYAPLDVSGARAEHVVAFERRYEGRTLVVAAGRWFVRLAGLRADVSRLDWADTVVAVPEPGPYRSLLTGAVLDTGAELELPAAALFADMPVALLLRAGGGSGG